MILTKFGCRVRELRTQRDMSQEKFALHIDMDRTYLASVESGKRNISLENISKIAKGFGITLEELFKGI
jgi:transcriptional regulator with XRE-family HTH domain